MTICALVALVLPVAAAAKLESSLTPLARAGRIDQLRARAGVAYKSHPKSPLPAYYLAYAEAYSGNMLGAISLAEEARKLAEAHPDFQSQTRFTRTVASLRAGRTDFEFPDRE